jgi:hypothetical protein
MAFAIRLALFLAFHRSQLFILLPPHSLVNPVAYGAYPQQLINTIKPSQHSTQEFQDHGRRSAFPVPSICQSQPSYPAITDDVWPFLWTATKRLHQYVFERGGHCCSSKLRNISWQLAIFQKKPKASNDVTAFIEYIINNVPYRCYCLGPFPRDSWKQVLRRLCWKGRWHPPIDTSFQRSSPTKAWYNQSEDS